MNWAEKDYAERNKSEVKREIFDGFTYGKNIGKSNKRSRKGQNLQANYRSKA